MKKIKIILMFLATAHLYSCGEEFLQPDPISFVSGESFFENEEELDTWVISMYDAIQGNPSTSTSVNHGIQYEFQLTEMRSDNTGTKSQEGQNAQFENYTVEATNGVVLDYYRSYYNAIFRANTVLANIDAASEANRAAIEAEARFMRGYAYFNLVRLYGDVPMIDRVITPEESDLAFTRVPTATIYSSVIVPDLENAVSGLVHDASNKNRASKAAAQALLAKVYLTQGDYNSAQTLLSAVIGTGDYALEGNFTDIFYNEGNDEVIFAIGYAGDDTQEAQGFSAEWLNAVGRTSGINYVTIEAVTALNSMGGDRALKSYREDQAQLGKFQVTKYLPNSSDPVLAGNDWIVLRYADVLLMYVEATMAGGTTTSDVTALSYFQAIRDRAGITTPVSSISSQELLDERRVELAFENHRFFDLVRFGVAESVLGSFAADNNYVFSGNDLLLPIPESEIGLSKGLMGQNPGY
ncbi:MAG: RagB/SusD family nutrient uptake outer membrane protein [Cyclobacteriaceae bacterium]